MTRSVAIIACANGFGHVRRCMTIARALHHSGADVTLFAPDAAIRRLENSTGVEARYAHVDFDTTTNAAALKAGADETAHWEKRLPAFDRFDIVVSDNLPEILALRPDAMLSGNFLWHQALPDISCRLAARARALLEAHRPVMLTYGPFVADGLGDDVRRISVPMLQERRPAEAAQRDGILVTCGRGGNLIDETAALIAAFAQAPRPTGIKVFVEPDLVPAAAPEWITAADYSPEMYDRLHAAVARPGMGTVGDCLASGVRIFAFHESGNLEMTDNAQKIAALAVGEHCRDGAEAWQRAIEYVNDPGEQAQHAEAVDSLEFGGADRAAVRILDQFPNTCSSDEHKS